MGKLFDLAKNALRRVLQRRTTIQPPQPPARPPVPPGVQPPPRFNGAPPVQPPYTGQQYRPGAPPIQPRPAQPPQASLPGSQPPEPSQPPQPQPQQPTSQEQQDIREVEEAYTEIQLFGRDRGHSDDMQAVMDGMRQVMSSNVYGYYFELENARSGLLYVTFLGVGPNGTRTDSPGTTYVYFDVPTEKFAEFQRASESSAGRAVWDYLRVRGSVWQHQHRYRLVQAHGDYIPRKATRQGFKTRNLVPTGQPKIRNSVWASISRLEHSGNPQIAAYALQMKRLLMAQNNVRRSTLPPRSFMPNRGRPNRGTPNRG
jgi:hypothetical protein